MAKDPAVLFYTSDFLTGTLFMTDSQVGQYIRLLCLQHQHGHLTKDQIIHVCHGNADALIFEKFEPTADGKYHNKRLHEEALKRKKFCEHQRENALKRWNPTKNKSMPRHKLGNATAMPLEDENENDNRDENKDSNKVRKPKNPAKQIPPTLDMVKSYAEEQYRLNKDFAEKFWNYYESNGWKVGKNPMKNWHSSMATWTKSDTHVYRIKTTKKIPTTQTQQEKDWDKLYAQRLKEKRGER